MNPSPLHLFRQHSVISALVRAAIGGLSKKATNSAEGIRVPGPEMRDTVTAPHPDLVRDFVRYCGGEPSSYRKRIPPLLFPQWAFPLITAGMAELPLDLQKVLNYACDLKVHGPLVADNGRLELGVQLMEVEENEKGIRLATRVVTGTRSDPVLIEAMMHALLPKRRKDGPRKKRASRSVPFDSRLVARRRFGDKAGRDFAILTGDINPIHWLPPYARAAGFKRMILHGFAQMGWASEAIIRNVFAGDVDRLRELSIHFKKPLLLPEHVGLYLYGDGEYAVGSAPGATPFGFGTYKDEN